MEPAFKQIFATLEAAVVAWRALPPVVKIRATVKLIGGPVFRRNRSNGLTTGRSRTLPNEWATPVRLSDAR
jgi:hypothetical protein